GDRRSGVRRFALLVFGGVVAQAAVGGLRVLLPAYKPLIAVPHALVAQSFFGAIVALAVLTSRRWAAPHDIRSDAGGFSLRRLTALSLGAVLGQLVLGAGFRHGAFGILPHAIGAALVAAVVVWTACATLRRHGRDRYLARPATALLVLLTVQATL